MCDRNRLREGSGLYRKKGKVRLSGVVFLFAALLCAAPSLAIDILDRPLDVSFRAAPTVVMFVLDDSGSMDWEFMTSESSGLFRSNYYIFPENPGDNNYGSGYMDAGERSMWKSQWFGYNRLYYNPASDYTPWPSNTGSGNLPNADTVNPRSNPMKTSATLALNDIYLSVRKSDIPDELHEKTMDQSGPNDATDDPDCGRWVQVPVGALYMDPADTWQVIIERAQDNGTSTASGAVKFLNTGDGSEVIIDDDSGDPGYREYGTWANSSYDPSYQGKTRYTTTVGAKAVYTPTLPAAGTYEVWVWWSCYDKRDSEAKVTVGKMAPRIEIHNSHYYLVDDADGNGTADIGEGVYLVDMDGVSRSCYRFEDGDLDGKVGDQELYEIAVWEIPVSIRPPVGLFSAASEAADLQNFANWYSFYRRRSLTAKAAVARTIVGVEGLKVGFYSINGNLKQEALSVKILQADGTVLDETHDLLTQLYGLRSSGGTPLREGLAMVGEYYKNNDNSIGSSPYETSANGGACQRVYAIAMTDGYWGQDTLNFGNQDGDSWSNTLADVAMKYYKEDLRDDLENFVPPTVCNNMDLYQSHQHMVTFSVSFGVFGSLNPEEYDACTLKNAGGQTPVWPNPFCGSCSAKIDDLWHAAANTRGEFFSASDPQSLVNSLTDIFIEIDAREISGSSVAVSAEKVYTEARMYEGSYLSINWTGDIKAYDLTVSEGSGDIVIDQEPVWSAAEKLDKSTVTWDNRKIITSDGSAGKPLRWANLTAGQKAHLANNEYMLKYLRGFRLSDAVDSADKAGLQPFRVRDSRLSDIVNSSPVKIGNSLYVGANDGMLHVFNAVDGVERFAYVPNLVFENLSALTTTGYQHRFYVDLTPVYYQPGLDETIGIHLVGGLGKGGKGYYCLDVTDVDTMPMTETGLAGLVKWEFSDSADLGYTFSSPVIIRTKSPQHKYIVVFGNGYNSVNGRAVLYVVDLLTGEEIKKIDTQVGDDNGLSSPAVTDVNNDRRVDYVYCGDLKGNLWKFDLSSADHNEWEVAFKDSTGTPLPLFTTAAGQPITCQPDVMYHCSDMGYLVAFGTGKYLGLSDLVDTTPQSIYGIWDYGDDIDDGECLGHYIENQAPDSPGLSRHPDWRDGEVRLLEQEVVSTTTDQDGGVTRTTTENPAEWDTVLDKNDYNNNQTRDEAQMPNPIRHIGWVLDLESPKERVYQDVVIRSGVLIVLSMIPVEDPCSGGGYSMVYTLDPCTGAQLGPAWADKSRKLEEPTIVEVHFSDGKKKKVRDKLIFSHTGPPPPPPPPPLGGEKTSSGKYFWRTIY